MRKILVPVDFSDFSSNAVEVASYIAKVKDMEVKLIHVMEDSYTPYYNMTGMGMVEDNSLFNYRKDLQAGVKVLLSKMTDKLKEKNIKVDSEVVEGSPSKVILQKAEEEKAEVIIMGSHGHSAIEDIFIGSNTEKVIRLSSVPVLSVHNIKPDYKINKIVFASDFEEDDIEAVLQRVISFAEIFMAELFLVRINTPSRWRSEVVSRQRLDELGKKFNLFTGAVTSYTDRSEENGILNYAREINADLITLGTHGRTGFARLFKGSIAEEVAGFSDIPVLTYNISKENESRDTTAIKRERPLRREKSKKKKDSE